jgi:hypothetical protein
MWNTILENLTSTGIGIGIFVLAYASNMCFSLYYNIKMLNQQFDKQRLIDSGFKIGTFSLGTVLLVISITTLPLFADKIGYQIPSEYEELLSNLTILVVFVLATCKYAFEALGKMKLILSSDKVISGEEIVKEQSKITY